MESWRLETVSMVSLLAPESKHDPHVSSVLQIEPPSSQQSEPGSSHCSVGAVLAVPSRTPSSSGFPPCGASLAM